MGKNNLWITALKTIDLNLDSQKNASSISPCQIRWRNKMLCVSTNDGTASSELPALKSELWLVNCLQKSPIEKIALAPQLKPTAAEFWAKAGQEAHKKVLLKTMSDRPLGKLQSTFAWNVKRIIDFGMALFLLLLFSPVMLFMISKQKLAGKPIFIKHRCVGKKGLLFETFQFARDSAKPHQGLSKFGLHNLPQLINVLRGEMTFVGRYYYSLDEVLTLNDRQRKIVNVIPGIIGLHFKRSLKTNATEIFLQDRDYLANWSLSLDLKILLLNLPLALLGKSAYQKTI